MMLLMSVVVVKGVLVTSLLDIRRMLNVIRSLASYRMLVRADYEVKDRGGRSWVARSTGYRASFILMRQVVTLIMSRV